MDGFFPVKKAVETVTLQDLVAAVMFFRCADIFSGRPTIKRKRVLLFFFCRSGFWHRSRGYCAELPNVGQQTIAVFCLTNCMLYNILCSQTCSPCCHITLIYCTMHTCKPSSAIYCQKNLSTLGRAAKGAKAAAAVVAAVAAAAAQRPTTRNVL